MVLDYLFHFNLSPDSSTVSMNMRNEAWWKNHIKPLIDAKMSGINTHNPVLIIYGDAHHSNQDKTGILDFIKNDKRLKIKRLLPGGWMEVYPV